MSRERINYCGNTYFFYLDKPLVYWFDKTSTTHIIVYDCTGYGGLNYRAEWRIPGTREKGIEYAQRMATKLSPWDIMSIGPTQYFKEQMA